MLQLWLMEKRRELVRRDEVDALIDGIAGTVLTQLTSLPVRCAPRGDLANTHQTVALDIVRRPKATPVHELERYMRCKDCSRLQGWPYKRSHLVALRPTKI